MSSITTMEKKIKQQKIKDKQQKESISSNNMGNNKNSNKLRLRDTLLNMLGEFVALNKSPEVRLSSASQQFLADAVLEEKRHLDKVGNILKYLFICIVDILNGGESLL